MENNNTQSLTNISDILYMCMSRWKWFVLSTVVCLAVAYLYIKMTPPTYLRSTSVLLLNSGDKKNNYADVDLESIGFDTPNTTLQNEMEMLNSPVLMEEVVDSLNLDVEYAYPGMFYDGVLYGAEVPIKVQFSDKSANGKRFKVQCVDNKNIIISDFNKPGDEDKIIKTTLNTKVQTPCGEIMVSPTPTYNTSRQYAQTIQITKYQTSVATERFLSRLAVEHQDDQSSVVMVSITDENTSRAEDILNVLMLAYDENWRNTQNRIVVNTSQFLAERISEFSEELGKVDNSIASYKGANLMPDAAGAGGMFMNQNNTAQNSIADYNTQLSLLKYIRKYMVDNMGSNRLLPTNIGVNDNAISTQISSFNTLQIQRNEMVAYAGDEHPKVRDLDKQLDILRKSIVESIDQSMVTIKKQMGGLHEIAGIAAGKIVTSTQQEKNIISSERDQKVKEAIYVFLLQEKEKTDMKINHSISNIRVTRKAGGSMMPMSPVKSQIMLIALALGLGIPAAIIFLLDFIDTKVHSRKDIEKLAMPFVGEIPLDDSSKQGGISSYLSKFSKHHHSNGIDICVEQNKRNVINEGFRMVRTNLEFMLKKDANCKVMLITSANPGSGKSFIAANLAKSMSLVNKKVLVIDLDMRRCTISGLVKDHHMHGLANYLGHYNDDIEEIVCHDAFCEGVDIIPVGTIPPNPTEILHDDRLGELINYARERYDIIILDCPPIDIVADADIVNQYADMTIFVIRAGLMDREWLASISKMYTEKRFNNICTLLNGTLADNVYSRHRYGGYYGHYHYGYGYYYGSDGKSKKKN